MAVVSAYRTTTHLSDKGLWRSVRAQVQADLWETLFMQSFNYTPREAAVDVLKATCQKSWHEELPRIKDICERLGIVLSLCSDLPVAVRCYLDDDNRMRVDVSDRLSVAGRAAAAAHAVGHVIFDSIRLHECSEFFGKRARTIESEERADDFAAHLLAPLWIVESVATSKRRTTLQLSELIGVPSALMSHQLRKLV